MAVCGWIGLVSRFAAVTLDPSFDWRQNNLATVGAWLGSSGVVDLRVLTTR